ncbi:trehalose operon repressor [Erysipelotrichaceae bacterium MTC7]|nr:trehalose operon repressor [Erysipelotrichaceae bacterium MTC7]
MTKYQRIYQDLLDKIKTKTYEKGTYLPSENELMKAYGSSRDTIRKALQLLLQNGYIQKVVGKGSIVLDSERIAFPVSGISSFKELKSTMDGDIETIVEEFNVIPADKDLKDELYMEDGDVYVIERIRSINGERIILDRDYLNGNVIQGLTIDHAKDSIYEYIENELKLNISFSRKEITVIPATKHDREVLDMLDYDLLVCVKSYSYLEDATLFEYTISKHRPDKFRFVDFARRTQ